MRIIHKVSEHLNYKEKENGFLWIAQKNGTKKASKQVPYLSGKEKDTRTMGERSSLGAEKRWKQRQRYWK